MATLSEDSDFQSSHMISGATETAAGSGNGNGNGGEGEGEGGGELGPMPERIDRFSLLERIGAGGMGELYSAYDAHLDRRIALKLVRADKGGSQANARLLREAQALAKLSHPNVVTVFEAGATEDRGVFVAMEYVRGKSLAKILRADRRRREDNERVDREILALFRDAARGLAAVHAAGLAHRDFKPDNVVVGRDGRVRVIDFGLARMVVEDSDTGDSPKALPNEGEVIDNSELTPEFELSTLTKAGVLVGTPRYMPAEQWAARRGDSRSDQFSFCVALYRLLYDQWPYPGETRGELMAAVAGGELRSMPRRAGVSGRLQAALVRGLARDPEDRAPDMSELIAALDELIDPPPKVSRGLVAALVAVVVFAFSTVLLRGSPDNPSLAAAYTPIQRASAAERRLAQLEAEIAELVSEGQHAEADAAFERFARSPEYAGTDALARAWLTQAARLQARGEPEAQLAALGEAQLASASATRRHSALLALAHALERRHHYPALGSVLTELEALEPETQTDPGGELWELQVREALARRDFLGARTRLEQEPEHPMSRGLLKILIQLERAQPSDHTVVPRLRRTGVIALPGVDLDEDGRSDLLLAPREGPPRVLSATPQLEVLRELDLDLDLDRDPAAFIPLQPASSGTHVVVHAGGRDRVYALHHAATGLEARPVLERAAGNSWATADDRLWAASPSERRLFGWRVSPRGLEALELSPSLAASTSVINSLSLGDLDGDRRDELLVGVGAWWAYDLRVLAPRPAREGEDPATVHLDLLARRKPGDVVAIEPIPAPTGEGQWLAAAIRSSPPNLRVFPSTKDQGEDEGVCLFAWAGPERGLERQQCLATPTISALASADLDGDGRRELLAQAAGGAMLLYLDGEAHYAAVWIEDLGVEAVVDLDDDGDDELLVGPVVEPQLGRNAEQALTIVGLGDAPLPARPRSSGGHNPPPTDLDPSLAERWRRAEALAGSGLAARAQTSLAELARQAPNQHAAKIHRRAAELGEQGGDRRLSAELYELAGDPASLTRALELHEQALDYADAARVAAGLAEHPRLEGAQQAQWRARHQALQTLAKPAARFEVDFREVLEPGWRVPRAELLQRDPEGLRVETFAGAPLLERELLWDGELLELSLDLELERLEWGSGLGVELTPIDAQGQATGPATLTKLISWGGAGHYTLRFDTGLRLEPGAVGLERVMKGALPPEGQDRFELRVALRAGHERARVEWRSLGEGPPDTRFEASAKLGAPLTPGRVRLRLMPESEPWVRGTVRLRELKILGASEAQLPPPSTRDRVALALVRDEFTRALELLDGPPVGEPLSADEAAWLRGLARERLGDWNQAVAEFERAFGDCESAASLERFAYAMLLRPDRLGPTLRRLCPRDAFLRSTATVLGTTSFQHKGLGDVHRTLTTQLAELERYDPPTLDLALVTMTLLTARARGWYMQQLPEAAEADLRRVAELADRQWQRVVAGELVLAEPLRLELMRKRALAHVGLGAVLMYRKKPNEAVAELERALEGAAAPAIIADVIAARYNFEPLHDTPFWVRLRAVQRGLAPVPPREARVETGP